MDSFILFIGYLRSSVCRLLQQTNAGPFENWAVNEETPIVTSDRYRKDSLLLRDISVVESQLFATLLIGEGIFARETDRFTPYFRVLWVSPFDFNFLALLCHGDFRSIWRVSTKSGDCSFFIRWKGLCFYFYFIFIFKVFQGGLVTP